MSKRTDRAYTELHRSREGFTRLLDELATNGSLDPRDAERLYDGLSRLNESWAGYTHALTAGGQ